MSSRHSTTITDDHDGGAEGGVIEDLDTALVRLGAAARSRRGPRELLHLELVVRAADGRVLVRAAAPALAPERGRVLRVDARGRWFEAPGGARVLCGSRPVMRRLLVLVEAACAEPPRPLGTADLVQAGWPDERIRPGAAKNRLHVMMSRLRQRGLRGILIGGELGYVLAADLEIEIVGA
jgi:hypothetical protein